MSKFHDGKSYIFIRGALGYLFSQIFPIATSIQSITGNISFLIALHSWKKKEAE